MCGWDGLSFNPDRMRGLELTSFFGFSAISLAENRQVVPGIYSGMAVHTCS